MAKKKNITETQLITWYIQLMLTDTKPLQSVFSFAKFFNFDEGLFYEHFSNFESLEKEIFASFCKQTRELLTKNEDYNNYKNSKYKLLSFYFTFFELLTVNRSFVFLKLKNKQNVLENIKILGGLRKEFMSYFKTLIIDKIDFKNKTVNKVQDKSISEIAWLQLLFTIKFWLQDESKSFEKTDVFIEKSINATFDIMDIKPLRSVLDLGKFLLKEKIPMP